MNNIVTVKTNYQARDVVRWYELTAKERKEFDYLDTAEKQDDASFFRYKGSVYCMDQFTHIGQLHALSDWQGVHSDSYFSGIVMRYTNDFDSVVVGTYMC